MKIKLNLMSKSNKIETLNNKKLSSSMLTFFYHSVIIICRLWAEIEAYKWRDLELNLSKTVQELCQHSQLFQANSKKKLRLMRDNKKLLQWSFAQI